MKNNQGVIDGDIIPMEGVVKRILPGTMFEVEVQISKDKSATILCGLAGRLKKNFIKLTIGDLVKIEVNKHDVYKGRIVYRGKPKKTYNPSAKGGVPQRQRGPKRRR